MLRTDARGERGDVCGRRKDETVGEIAEELVVLLASAKVLVNVLAKSLGLSWVSLLPVVVSPLVGGAKSEEDDKASDTVETVEPALLFAGEVGREP